ncbi:hypothetical protein KPH14_008133 [Odynerus spinipes]|uniref:Zinc finger PHD-type domain-containing protein n=1 Tax=Odynerus spinipes TaxID=1348599 RepID=A0AAD9VHW8_9HYME|nr:hypothetical protein KPH14_008133 [Odynerus spinipes]
MDQVCKGCLTKVAKPVSCGVCGIVSHPGCVQRTGHPSTKGKFLDCVPCDASQASNSPTIYPVLDSRDRAMLDHFRQICREELDNILTAKLQTFERHFSEVIEGVKSELTDISVRVCTLETKIGSLSSSSTTSSPLAPCNVEDVISELADRDRRSRNIMIFNLEETSSETSSATNSNAAAGDNFAANVALDKQLVDSILKQISPTGEVIKINHLSRVGSTQRGRPRPAKVVLDSRAEVMEVLKNTGRYKGPARITEDCTAKQRAYLRSLRTELNHLHETGDVHKTIRFVNGVPRIVNSAYSASRKN